MDDGQAAARETRSARAKEADDAHKALLDAIGATYRGGAPHERLCVHWDGFGDQGWVDAVAWGVPDPAEEAGAAPLTCIIDEKAERPPPSVTEAATNFAYLAMSAHPAELKGLCDNDGGDVSLVLDCASGRATVNSRRRERQLKALDPNAARAASLPLNALDGTPGEARALGLFSGGAQAVADLGRGLSRTLRSLVPASKQALAEDVAREGIAVRYLFSAESGRGVIEEIMTPSPLRGDENDGDFQWWSSHWCDLVDELMDKGGIDDVCTGLADRAGHEWTRKEGCLLSIEMRFPIDPEADGAAVAITREVVKWESSFEDIATFDMPPRDRPRAASSPDGPGL